MIIITEYGVLTGAYRELGWAMARGYKMEWMEFVKAPVNKKIKLDHRFPIFKAFKVHVEGFNPPSHPILTPQRGYNL